MERLERNPLVVLDGIRRLAERIECDVLRVDAESQRDGHVATGVRQAT